MTDFKAAIFDMDGTLLDSMWVWLEVDRKFLEGRGLPMDEEYTRAIQKMDFAEAAEFTIRRYGFTDTPEMLIQQWNKMAVYEYEHAIFLKPFAREYLTLLREKGIKLAIATASPKELYEPALLHNGIYDWFDVIVTVAQAGRGKRFPDIYLLAAQKLNIPPKECAVFEDILPGVESAKAAGMRSIGVYDPSSEKDLAAIEKAADLFVRGFDQLL